MTMNRKSNILLITADQMRWDCLRCMGNEIIETPNLDRIASRGVLFKNAFTPDPICVPARASIMTGNYPHVCTGVKANAGRIKDNQPLLTETLKSAGYKAYAVGKLHFVPYAPPGEPRLVHGFEKVDLHESGRILGQYDPQGKLKGVEDYFDYLRDVGYGGFARGHGIGNNDVRPSPSPLPAEHYVDHWIADNTMKRIDEHVVENSENPFFIWMSSPKPHSPYDPPRPYDEMYDPRSIAPPVTDIELLKRVNPSVERNKYSHYVDSVSPEAWQVIRSYYYGSISFLDAMIGRVVRHLEKIGKLNDTVILFSADHGDLLGDFGGCFKTNHLNGSVRVPFLAAGPNIKQGVVSDELVGLQDIMPTFAGLAGVDIGQSIQGLDLSQHLAEPSTPVRDYYYSTTMKPGRQSGMIVDKEWKYVYSEENATEELYNELEDPYELNNLVGIEKFENRRSDMRLKLFEYAERLGDTELIAGGDFPVSKVDRDGFLNKRPSSSMGWRFY